MQLFNRSIIIVAAAATVALASCTDSGAHSGGPSGAGGSNAGAGGSSAGAGGSNAGAGGSSAGAAGSNAGAGGSNAGTGGSSAGAAGSNAGAGGSNGGAGGTPPARVFAADGGSSALWPLLKPCDAAGACPEGQICFHLTAELAVCDGPQSVRTTCAFSTDECDCTGRTCAAGRVCVQVNISSALYNTCLEAACASPSDCGGGSVCTPASLILGSTGTAAPPSGRCFTPVCRSDADCSGGVDGRCALVELGESGATRHLQKVGCVFAGQAAAATACAPGDATAVRADPSSQTPPYYTCAGR